jgi:adenine deaminase
VAAGVSTDHECTSIDEAKEKLDLGMKIIIREGSAACDFEALYPLIQEYPGQLLFCSDDMYPDDVETIGYINGLVKRAVAKGMPLWETLETACLTPVTHYKLKNGLLKEGDAADFIIVNNLDEFKILSTYIQGYEVYNANIGVTDALQCASAAVVTSALNKFKAE